jgi:hypothetical protein
MSERKNNRPGLGINPLDALMAGPPPTTKKAETPSKSEKKQESKPQTTLKQEVKTKKTDKIKKVRTTYHLPEPLVEGLRNAAMHLAGPPEYLSLSLLVEQGLQEKLTRLQKKHTNGDSFPERPRDLTGGRPSK